MHVESIIDVVDRINDKIHATFEILSYRSDTKLIEGDALGSSSSSTCEILTLDVASVAYLSEGFTIAERFVGAILRSQEKNVKTLRNTEETNVVSNMLG